MAESAHFVVACRRHPEFSFVVPQLRKYRKEQGSAAPSGVVRFNCGVLDSRNAGLDEEEARLVLAALKKRDAVPAWGTDIFEPGQEPTGGMPNGRMACPVCQQHGDSVEWLRRHLAEKHDDKRPQQKAA